MHCLGTVSSVQIQRCPLKSGQEPQRFYSPQAISPVDHLRLTRDGVIGVTPDGTNIIDVHHAAHGQSRFRGSNGISIGFGSHYSAMRQRFGEHLQDGIAGENIILQNEGPAPSLDDMGLRVAFYNPGSDAYIYLNVVGAIAPCVPFSKFCTQQPTLAGPPLKETLQYLDGGRRGFLLELVRTANNPPIVRPGDQLLLVKG